MFGKFSNSDQSVSVARSVPGLITVVVVALVSKSTPPENPPRSRREPFAIARIKPWVREKSPTVWLVSEKSQ